MRVVENKFGVDTYSKALRKLQSLKQLDTLETYMGEFEHARYMASVHNPELDEIFFVTQFIHGLNMKIQGVVQMHQPTTMDKVVLLAQLQQDVLDKGMYRGARQGYAMKQYQPGNRMEGKVQQAVGDLYRERQDREFRRLNGLCYACCEKFEPGHLLSVPRGGRFS